VNGDFVTILTAKGGRRATKLIIWRQDLGFPEIRPYDNMRTFSAIEEKVSGIADLAALLERISVSPSAFIVRGRVSEGVDRNRMLRRVRARGRDGLAEPATLEAAAHYWIPIDFDALPCPDGLDAVHESDQTVEYAVSKLPEAFHRTTCRWAFTSSQGFKPGINLRLFFWADRPLSDEELKAWLAERVPAAGQLRTKWPRRWPLDPALFNPAQPIYTAAPIIVGMADTVPVRSGLWVGDRDLVIPQTIAKMRGDSAGGEPVTAKLPGTRESHDRDRCIGYEYYRPRIGDHEGGDGFFVPLKSAVASYIARNGANADTDWLRDDLARAIREAPCDRAIHSSDYIEARIRDLVTLIQAIVELHRASEASRQQQECEPTYPAPLPTVIDAEERFRRALEEHVLAVLTYREAMTRWNAHRHVA
jgi:hypothetical protein